MADSANNYRSVVHGLGNGQPFATTLIGDSLKLTKGNYDPDGTGGFNSAGIQALRGAMINVGTQEKAFSAIDIQSHGTTAYAIGVMAWRGPEQKKDSHVNIHGDVVNINVSSQVGRAYGLHAYNDTQDPNIPEGERSSIDVKAGTINITASADTPEYAPWALLFGRRPRTVWKRSSGTPVNATVDVQLTNADSCWKGNSIVTRNSTTDPSNLQVENFSLTLADGARKSSFVNNLTLDNGVLDVTSEGNTLKVDSLQGTSGNVRLGARMVDGRVVANNVQVGSVSQKVKGLDVTFDGVTSDEVETPEEVADLMKNSVTIGSGKSEDFKQTGTVEEGAINGSVSVETDAKGEIVSSTTAENTKLEDFKEVTSVSFVQWRNEVNHLTRRMGDLRSSESGVGAWARVHGGESKVKNSSVEFDTTSVQVGADARVEDWIVGSALSYSDSSIDLANGDGDGESWSLAVYASRFIDSGAFIDLTGRYGYLKNEFTSKDMGVKTDNHAFALSAEVGHRFEVAKNAYVEPQVELAYGFIKGDNVTASNGVRVEQDDAQTLTGRVGLRFGADCPNDRGTVYGLVSYNYEFLGDIESRASLGDKSARMERSLDGGWFSYGIGAQANISKTWSAYGELERTSGGDVENPWRWSVGVRHVF